MCNLTPDEGKQREGPVQQDKNLPADVFDRIGKALQKSGEGQGVSIERAEGVDGAEVSYEQDRQIRLGQLSSKLALTVEARLYRQLQREVLGWALDGNISRDTARTRQLLVDLIIEPITQDREFDFDTTAHEQVTEQELALLERWKLSLRSLRRRASNIDPEHGGRLYPDYVYDQYSYDLMEINSLQTEPLIRQVAPVAEVLLANLTVDGRRLRSAAQSLDAYIDGNTGTRAWHQELDWIRSIARDETSFCSMGRRTWTGEIDGPDLRLEEKLEILEKKGLSMHEHRLLRELIISGEGYRARTECFLATEKSTLGFAVAFVSGLFSEVTVRFLNLFRDAGSR